MRPTFLIALAYLVAGVFAGGYQGCLERVMLFYAYGIDELNPPKDRSIGFKCDFFDDRAKKCMGKWVPCRGGGGGRCNFNELMAFIGKSRTTDKLVAGPNQNTQTPDIEETAKNLYIKYTSGGGKNKVTNYPPHKIMKYTTHRYQPFIHRLGGIVNDASVMMNNGNKALFDGFDSALEQLNIARTGDHGIHLVKEAQAKLGSKMDVVVENLGQNPATGEKWVTVDWAATEEEARKKGVKDYKMEIEKFKDEFYAKPIARDHLEVMKAFKHIQDSAASCR